MRRRPSTTCAQRSPRLRKATTEAKPFGPGTRRSRASPDDTGHRGEDRRPATTSGPRRATSTARRSKRRASRSTPRWSLTTSMTGYERRRHRRQTARAALSTDKPLRSEDKNRGAYRLQDARRTDGREERRAVVADRLHASRRRSSHREGPARLLKDRTARPRPTPARRAKTIAIVARKTLEKFDAEAQCSQQFSACARDRARAAHRGRGAAGHIKALDLATRDLRTMLQNSTRRRPATTTSRSPTARAAGARQDARAAQRERSPNLVQPVAGDEGLAEEGKTTIAKRRIRARRRCAEGEGRRRAQMANTISNQQSPTPGPRPCRKPEPPSTPSPRRSAAAPSSSRKTASTPSTMAKVKSASRLQGKIATRKPAARGDRHQNALVQSLADARRIEAARARPAPTPISTQPPRRSTPSTPRSRPGPARDAGRQLRRRRREGATSW